MTVSLALLRAPRVPAIRTTHVSPSDVVLAAVVLAVEVVLAATLPQEVGGHRPDLLGWILLTGSALVLVWRRQAPMWCMTGMVACVAPYHYLQNNHTAPTLATMVALYALAVAGPPIRTFLERYLTLVTTAVVVLIVLGFVVLKYLG